MNHSQLAQNETVERTASSLREKGYIVQRVDDENAALSIIK